MNWEMLRREASILEASEDADYVDGPDIPAHLDEQAPPQPWDDGYTHAVFFDPDRFPTDAERDELLERVRRQFPENLRWSLEPVSALTLHGRMHIYSAYHTSHFQQNGYIAEIEPARFKSGPRARRSLRSQQAWDAFYANCTIAEAVTDAWQKLPAVLRENAVFEYPLVDAVAPIIGRFDDNDQAPGASVLYNYHGMLVAPRRLLAGRREGGEPWIAYPAEPVTVKTAFANGRRVLNAWTSDDRRRIRQRVYKEIRAWSELQGDRFRIDAILLWIVQTLAILRVQATEWKLRENPSYVRSGTREFEGDEHAFPSKAEFLREEFRSLTDGLRGELPNFCAPTIKRPPVTARADVISLLAGGIGLEDEAIWRDDRIQRDNLARQELGYVASWIGELKRFHRATLTAGIAQLIEQVVNDEGVSLQELEMADDRSGPCLIKAQFPVAVWRQMLDLAIETLQNSDRVEIQYRWNDIPTDPIVVLRDDDVIIIVGPLLDLSAERRAGWAARADELFEKTRSLLV
ncbi:hypothetical protein ACVWWG_003854 [Bradyrhizobium sp. LB7.2]